MTDIFREVEEDVRRERFEKLWKQYGDYVFVAVAAVAIGVAGYKLYQRYEFQQRLNAAQTFTMAQEAAYAGNSINAATTFAKLAKDAPGGYATVSKLAEANSLMMAGNRSAAVTLYKEIAEKDTSPLGSVARIRAGWAMVESAPKAELETLLAPLTAADNEWRFMAREVLAYSDYHAGAMDAARKEFQTLVDDKNTPKNIHDRAGAMATFLKAGGDREAGTVPPEPKPVLPEGQPAAQDQPGPAQPAPAEGQPSP